MSIYEQFSDAELAILRKRAERVARSLTDDQLVDALSVLEIVVGSERYALPTQVITAVYENVSVIPMPCVPAIVAGIANIRGHIIPVLDLRIILGITGETAASDKLVVLSHDDIVFALLVADTHATQTVSAASFLSLPDNPSLSGLLADGTALLNLKVIFNNIRQSLNVNP
jgi:purine-binding chemotaxis protein CheW